MQPTIPPPPHVYGEAAFFLLMDLLGALILRGALSRATVEALVAGARDKAEGLGDPALIGLFDVLAAHDWAAARKANDNG